MRIGGASQAMRNSITENLGLEEVAKTLAEELGCFVAGLDLVAVAAPVVQKARTCLPNVQLRQRARRPRHAVRAGGAPRQRWTASAIEGAHCSATAARPR
jgi:hypothetical protein